MIDQRSYLTRLKERRQTTLQAARLDYLRYNDDISLDALIRAQHLYYQTLKDLEDHVLDLQEAGLLRIIKSN